MLEPRRYLAVPVLALALVLAGCGGGDDGVDAGSVEDALEKVSRSGNAESQQFSCKEGDLAAERKILPEGGPQITRDGKRVEFEPKQAFTCTIESTAGSTAGRADNAVVFIPEEGGAMAVLRADRQIVGTGLIDVEGS